MTTSAKNSPAVAAGAYITGLFDNHQWTGGPTQSALIASQINEYILWSIHVDAKGDLSYNNEKLCVGGALVSQTADPLRGLIQAGRSQGAAQSVYLSIGAGGVSDFQNIENLMKAGGAGLANLYANLGQIFGLGADGFDFDYEENVADPVEVISELGVQIYKQLGAKISYCPYWNEGFWIDCLKATLSKADGVQPVIAFNLQCYSGGGGNDPRSWVTALQQAGASTGVADPAAFVRPGLAVAGSASGPNYGPGPMTTQLQTWQAKNAWIWNTANVMQALSSTGDTLADYGKAMLAGCQSDRQSKAKAKAKAKAPAEAGARTEKPKAKA